MDANPKLVVLSEQLRGQAFELTEDRYTIGRSDDTDICIVDPTVSGLHCELLRNEDGSYTAVDEEYSTNGTRVNGAVISRQSLVNSDILQVGGVECMYDFEQDTPSSVISTQTQITIEEEVIQANPRTNLAPEQLQSKDDNPVVKLAFKILIGVLALVVLGLSFYLIVKIAEG